MPGAKKTTALDHVPPRYATDVQRRKLAFSRAYIIRRQFSCQYNKVMTTKSVIRLAFGHLQQLTAYMERAK
jgi:hypothetical protein